MSGSTLNMALLNAYLNTTIYNSESVTKYIQMHQYYLKYGLSLSYNFKMQLNTATLKDSWFTSYWGNSVKYFYQ
jgi:spore coat protein CotF